RKARGRRGETLAAWLLRARGVRVLARNVVVRGAGEIDVLGREGRTLVLVEVKSRRAGGGEEAVGWQRQRSLRRCAECLMADPAPGWADEVGSDGVGLDAWRARYLRDASCPGCRGSGGRPCSPTRRLARWPAAHPDPSARAVTGRAPDPSARAVTGPVPRPV